MKVNGRLYEWFASQLKIHQDLGEISSEQVNQILSHYEVKQFSFIRILVSLGAILIGFGILSFIASNWEMLGKPIRLGLIFASYSITLFLGFKLREALPKTSRSFIYLAMIIYGAGIFLIGQMFHFAGHFSGAFLLWAIGVIPISIYLKDGLLFLFAQILTFIYFDGSLFESHPYWIYPLIVLFYFVQRYFSAIHLFITNGLVINWLIYIMAETLDIDLVLILFVLFILGIGIFFYKFTTYSYVFKIQGSLLFGITGFMLTFKDNWYPFVAIKIAQPSSIVFSVLFLAFLLFLIRKENLFALALFGIIIIRFYFDTMYDFMPKSLFFLSSGLILLLFGYYFERKRKEIKNGSDINE